MISLTDAQLNAWLISFIWPLTRILGLIMVAPVFGHSSVPRRVKIGLGVFIALIIAPTLPPMPDVGLGSWHGLFILIQQLLIGMAIGFIMRIVFAAVEAAGEIVGLQMGLGFASFFDPQSAGQTIVISQFFNLLASLLFLAVNAHLLLLGILVESFKSLPISPQPLSTAGFYSVANYGSVVFSVGLQLALPLIAILLMTNLALGILTRSAPQLNIFAIGFPITLGVGLIALDITLPYFTPQFEHMFRNGFAATTAVIRALHP
ncbi:MAG: flagellar biosynthetic protein FliR [Thiobacillus sp.]|uniref:flagellar biosynthetic protein FliR n=1 Tax=unclassified Thiobacillus TaxID=2646513 RepID=UPI00086B5717|nr:MULTISPECIES: flagellar biosynthetic protein FliR [unclassified Thiobacillus]MBS0260299.1 flagellar biosynthetic protein FliR [Pseudomonadota bacterium]MBN8771228.1 flagellar biosynthetic protein FliR [Thiobacillus sp.]MBN8780738.1 flagellar biosynthetic protein FliR [Thiobacillus sp.]MBS0310218.1 flagellar biosynthetic protein FliR [Pseudomonadota bacterium]ODV02668.1 MAG: flagellar biosynthetic protein FliR [Thiobacillus sp. SCN 63-57]